MCDYIYSSVCGQRSSYYCTAPLYGPMAICSWITLPSLTCTHVCEQHNEEFMMMDVREREKEGRERMGREREGGREGEREGEREREGGRER